MLIAALLLGTASSVWGAPSDYDGTYSGTYTGDDNGYWVAIADAVNGTAFLSFSTTRNAGDLGFMAFGGETAGVGNYFTGSTTIQDSSVDADITLATGSVSGTWSNNVSGDAGTLSGDLLTSSPHAGTYSGSFGGDDAGTWELTIAQNGHVTGTITSNSGGGGTFEGGCHADGVILIVGEADDGSGFALFGRISAGNITGSWIAEDGSEGTIGPLGSSGASGAGSSGGGGGGGGCFILSLLE